MCIYRHSCPSQNACRFCSRSWCWHWSWQAPQMASQQTVGWRGLGPWCNIVSHHSWLEIGQTHRHSLWLAIMPLCRDHIMLMNWLGHTFPVQQSECTLYLLPAACLIWQSSGVSFRPAPLPGYKTAVAWLQDGFKMAAAASRFNPLPLTFTKILHHSSHLSIFGMLSPVYSHARLSPGTSWSSLTAVIYVLLGCKHWWCHNQFFPPFSLEGNYQTS